MITLNNMSDDSLKKIELYIKNIADSLNINTNNEHFYKIIDIYKLLFVEYLYFKNNNKNDKKLIKKIDSLNYKNNTLHIHVKVTLPFYYKYYCDHNFPETYNLQDIEKSFSSILFSLRSLNSYENTFDNPALIFSNFKFYISLFFKESLLILRPMLTHFIMNNNEDFEYITNLFFSKENDDSYMKEYIIFLLNAIKYQRVNTKLFKEFFYSLQVFSLNEFTIKHYTDIIISTYIERYKLSNEVALFLNNMFNKNYDIKNMQQLSEVDVNLLLKMYNMEESLFLENLNLLYSNNKDFLNFKEAMWIKKEIDNF